MRIVMSPIKKFCDEYRRKLELDKDIAENDLECFKDNRDRITFSVNVMAYCPISNWSAGYNGENLITLDEEDLEYLYNKYRYKLTEEMEANIQKIRDEYKTDIGI